jgi:HEAT repeat protein
LLSSLRSDFGAPFRGALAAAAIAAAALTGGDASAFVWPNVPDQIARSLASGDVTERRLAAQRLGELPAETAIKLIQRSIGDPDVEVRLRVGQAAIAFRMPKAGDLVIGWLSEGDARLRLAACDVIRAAPTDRSVVALGRVLGDPDPHVRLAAAAAMGASGLADAVSPLLGHLDDPSPEVRAEVARALGRIGDARAVVPLIGKVQDSVSDVRRTVARALGELGDLRAASALMLALQDTSPDVRLEAVGALGKLRSDEATVAIAPLIEASDASDGTIVPSGPMGRPSNESAGVSEVRAAALRALGRIGSEAAVKVLAAALAKDDPSSQRSPVRDALITAGKPAVAALITTLSASPSQTTAAGAALVLGALKAKEGLDAIVRGMQRGVIPLRHGLRALASLESPDALSTVLELLGDSDPTVRKEAIRAASALLDPARPDGRAVDPASAALKDPDTAADEKVEIIRMLGRTGSPRAQKVLLPIAKTKSIPLRLAVLDALGSLKVSSPEVDAALLEALGDESSDVRLRAATALAIVGSPQAASKLLSRLAVAAEQDRGAIGIALSGALARAGDPRLAEKVGASLASAPDVARDALLEGLGRMPGAIAGSVLVKLASGSIDDRRKVAEALAGHPEPVASAALQKLAADADPGVRANAVWSLGAAGKKDAIALLAPLLKDPDAAVAGNAAAAIGRIAAREADSTSAREPLCAALLDPRAYVRANALSGLSLAGARCEPATARDLLARDPAEAVRLAAADALARGIARDGDKAEPADRRALARCASEDKNATVALRCQRPLGPVAGTEDVGVFIVPDGRSAPVARAPFALVRADGLLRLGTADRRGEIFELGAPRGMIRLAVPAPLAR